jgi:putative aminopeptidase FrvX
MKDLIGKLADVYGPSGHEGQVRALIEGLARDAADELRTDAMGNLIALKRGSGGADAARGKRIMVAAHMDEIGLIVTFVDKKGFLRVGRVGGVFLPTLVGSQVRFANGATGVVGREKWLAGNSLSALPKWEEIYIDVGATSPEDAPVGVGDVGVFVQPYADLGARVVGKAMDDRIGCAIALEALRTMGESPNDVYFCFTVQEEVGTRGALVSAFGVEPEVGVAIDVTDTGDTPESQPMAVSLGGGPAIKVMDSGFLTHPGVKDWMIAAAERLSLPYQLEVLLAGSTDARAIQTSRAGVPAGCISVPARYVHTQSEMVDMGDVEGSVRLLVELLVKPVTFWQD